MKPNVTPPKLDGDTEMKDGNKSTPRNKPNPDEPKRTRQSDFAREVDSLETIQRLLNQRHSFDLSFKELLAISGEANQIVNKGSRQHLGPVEKKVVAFGTTSQDSETEDRSWSPPIYRVFNAEVNHLERSRTLIKFPGKVNGNPVEFMIDTGSMIDVCPRSIYENFSPRIPLRVDEHMYLSGINGSPKKMDGIMLGVTISIGSMDFSTNLHANESGPPHVILGQPFLNRYRFEHSWDKDDNPVIRFSSEVGVLEFPYKSEGYFGVTKGARERMTTRERAQEESYPGRTSSSGRMGSSDRGLSRYDQYAPSYNDYHEDESDEEDF